MTLLIRCVRDNEHESDGDRKFSSTHSQVDISWEKQEIFIIFAQKDSYL